MEIEIYDSAGTLLYESGAIFDNDVNYDVYTGLTLAPGTYSLKCIDNYGDGWHGDYFVIDGVHYCEDIFNDGHASYGGNDDFVIETFVIS